MGATSLRPSFRHTRVDASACAALAVIGLAAYWLGIRPVFDEEERERRLRGQVAQSREQLVATQGEYGRVRSEIEHTRERLSRSAVVLHTAEGLATRQEDVTRTVLDAGIQLEQLVVGTAMQGELLDTIPLHLTGSGTYPQVVQIMHELRTGFPDMAITSFQMSSLNAHAGAPTGSEKSGKSNAPEKLVPTVRFLLDIAWYTARSEQERG